MTIFSQAMRSFKKTKNWMPQPDAEAPEKGLRIAQEARYHNRNAVLMIQGDADYLSSMNQLRTTGKSKRNVRDAQPRDWPRKQCERERFV
jgi:hypothetical protein